MSKITVDQEASAQKKRGVLLVLTGPSGAGKDAVLKKLQEKNPHLIKIVTTTSREKRVNESEGNPYYFISREEFEKKIGEDAFFEWVEFRGELYGTQKQTLTNALSSGNDVVWKIEAKGVKNIKDKVKKMVERNVFVFLTAPVDVLKNRVEKDEGELAFKRWNESLVLWEREQYDDCEYLVYNEQDELASAVEDVAAIMRTLRIQIKREE